MVFFTCNTCGASLKKNQVEKHYQHECPNCQVLSCMDCGKDFHGDEYAAHTKCISEAQKYQGALYKGSSEGKGKGEKKQQDWIDKVRQSVCSASVSPRVASLLERIADYPNIPRKKAKFENFVKNSFNVRDKRTLGELWEAFSGAASTQQPDKSDSTIRETQQTVLSSNSTDASTDGTSSLWIAQDEETPTPEKKKKKKKKEKHLKDESTSSDGDGAGTLDSTDEEVDEIKSRKRKRRHEGDGGQGDSPRELEGTTEGTVEQQTDLELEQLATDTPSKKKKHKHRTRRDNGHAVATLCEDAHVSQEVESDRKKSRAVAVNGKKTKRHKNTETEELPPVKKKKHKHE